MTTDLLIMTASWEERFSLGVERLVADRTFSKAIMLHYREYDERTLDNRNRVLALLSERGVSCATVQVSFADPIASWHSLNQEIESVNPGTALVDITTMPRDTLWSTFALLKERNALVSYVYHRPVSYDPNWLSRDPGRPRLVYRLSGFATLGRPTCLIITTGFDPERTRQLMWFYEPRKILLGFQSGEQFNNKEKNIACHQKALQEEYREFDVREFELDAYSVDHGAGLLAAEVDQWRQTHNIVMTSLGPKLGAVAMYRIHATYTETALAYTPSGEFNKDYSTGISESYYGML